MLEDDDLRKELRMTASIPSDLVGLNDDRVTFRIEPHKVSGP